MFSLPDRIEYLVRSTSVGLCGETKRKGMDFIFCEKKFDTKSTFLVNACVSVGLASLVAACPSSAVLASCVPIIVPMTNSLLDAGVPIGEDAKRSMSHMMSVNSAQLSFGLVEFLMGDIVNGFVHMLMAGVGFYVTRVDGIVMLPTFSMASTVFASVSIVNLIDMFLTKGPPSGELALTTNFIRLATICHPFLYAVSAYYAWKLIEQLRMGLLNPQGVIGPLDSVTLLEPGIETRTPFGGRGFRLNQPQITSEEQEAPRDQSVDETTVQTAEKIFIWSSLDRLETRRVRFEQLSQASLKQLTATITYLLGASAAIMLIPEISPLSPMSAIGPLIFVVAASELREFLEELGAAKRDKKANLALVDKVSDRVPTQTLYPGDIVIVRKDEGIPADSVLLLSSSPDGTAFVETANLDGETNLKIKRSPALTMNSSADVNGVFGFQISCQPPNADMYVFKGVVKAPTVELETEPTIAGEFTASSSSSEEPLNLSHLLLRGCTLRNTEWVAAVVVYSGHDTKMLLNARSGLTPSKVTSIDMQMNRNVISLFAVQMILCIIASAIGVNSPGTSPSVAYWYFAPLDSVQWISLFLTYFILLNTLIPASLWVCVEILKFIQAFFIEADPSVSIRCNSKNTHEELGQITHVFSDKTGTLTVNKMKFVGCHTIAGMFYDASGPASTTDARLVFPGVLAPSENLVSKLLVAAAVENSTEAKLMRCLAICHTCERIQTSPTEVTNQSSSPDEASLVSLAADCGWMFAGRPEPSRVRLLGPTETFYTILHSIAFTSERRMMTVVVRDERSGEILVLCKGADSSVVPKTVDGSWVNSSVNDFSARGFRTLCIAEKSLSGSEWLELATKLNDPETNSRIESEMTLLGCTAVEDRLQEGVVETLSALKAAGIMVCMITGDKRETAINIARSCGLISTKRNVFTMLSHSHMYGGGQFVPLRSLQELQHNAESNPGLAGAVWQLATERMGLPAPADACPPPMEGPLGRQVTHPSALLSGKFSLVIDGVALSSIFASSSSTQQLVNVLSFQQCEAVVFCRVSPKQKGQVVALVQEYLAKTVRASSALAIGDGANDINMINIANVGVGISGNEGAQAANSADYSISQFSDLNRLLFFHGRLNYKRTSVFVNLFMYKNFLFTLCQFWFATVSLFSGQTVFDDAYVLLYNSIFCLVPLFITGLIDKDHTEATKLKVNEANNESNFWSQTILPKMYTSTERFTEWSMLKWCLIGTLQSLSVFYICWLGWAWTNTALGFDGRNASIWMDSLVSYTAQIFIVSFVNMWVTTEWTGLFLACVGVFNFALYFGFVFVYNLVTFGSSDYMSGIATNTMGNLQFWLLLALIVSIAFAPLMAFTKLMEYMRPKAWLSIADTLRMTSRSPVKSNPPV